MKTTNSEASVATERRRWENRSRSKETILRDTGQNYGFSAGKLFNLHGDSFIKDHGDVTGKQIVNAVLNATAKPK